MYNNIDTYFITLLTSHKVAQANMNFRKKTHIIMGINYNKKKEKEQNTKKNTSHVKMFSINIYGHH